MFGKTSALCSYVIVIYVFLGFMFKTVARRQEFNSFKNIQKHFLYPKSANLTEQVLQLVFLSNKLD